MYPLEWPFKSSCEIVLYDGVLFFENLKSIDLYSKIYLDFRVYSRGKNLPSYKLINAYTMYMLK